jgi:hypothetical protein
MKTATKTALLHAAWLLVLAVLLLSILALVGMKLLPWLFNDVE